MALRELTKSDFDTAVRDSEILVILSWAEWCPTCKGYMPVFLEVAEGSSDIAFATVNTGEQSELLDRLAISHVPAISVFRDGIMLFSQAGTLTEEQLTELLRKVRQLDMDRVRGEQQATAARMKSGSSNDKA